nr:serine/threonine-protein kinase [Deinobacterium chartae]
MLHEGPFVRVQLARWQGQRVVVKSLKVDQGPARERFDREGEIAERLEHPNIVRLLARMEGLLVYEYLEGPTLRQLLWRGPLGVESALRYARGMLAGIAYAHAQGVYHLDLKPENIVIESRRGQVKLIDFGGARDVSLSRITHLGQRLGTPHYMAPEQFKGHRDDPRSDLYSIAVVTFEMVVGHPPFEDPLMWLLGRNLEGPPRAALERMPLPLRQWVEWGLERDLEERPASALAYLTELEHVQEEL